MVAVADIGPDARSKVQLSTTHTRTTLPVYIYVNKCYFTMAEVVRAGVLIVDIKKHSQELPATVPVAQKDGEIHQTIIKTHGEDHWETFNRRLDILFGEDSRDKATKRLNNIQRGKYGMQTVCTYLSTIDVDAKWFLAEAANVKRIYNELVKIL